MSNLEEHGVRIHPMAEVFPLIAGAGRDQLVVDIAAHGVMIPIVWSTDGGELVDGRNRLDVWLTLGRDIAECPSVVLGEGVDPVQFIVSANLARRQMTTAQKALTAARAMPIFMAAAALRQAATQFGGDGVTKNSQTVRSSDEAGQAFGVSRAYVDQARKLLDYPQFAKQVDEGLMNIPQALKALADSRETSDDGTYLRAEHVMQPSRETSITQADVLAWFRTADYEQAVTVSALIDGVMYKRANSVTPSPFTTDEKTAQQITKALEIADIRSNNSKDNAHA